jgi:hypothetical protein
MQVAEAEAHKHLLMVDPQVVPEVQVAEELVEITNQQEQRGL